MRQKISVSPEVVRNLFQQSFKRKDVANLLGVSFTTLERRMAEYNIKVRHSYTDITDSELDEIVNQISENHPNCGMKMMNGYLKARGIKVPSRRVENSLRRTDPLGVQCRTSIARLIVRRVYYVQHSNEIWHLNTNLKLSFVKMTVKGAVDGKSRCCIYLDIADNNTSASQMASFLQGVHQYGLPLRTRSDKGAENRRIAEFMLDNRGLNRGSHICGRSVHNTRIERFWLDTYKEVLEQYIVLFTTMQNEGWLDVNNDMHIRLLHYIFLRRIQTHLDSFQLGWNQHKLRTESSKSPTQLMLLHLPPPHKDLCLAQEIKEISLFPCNLRTDALRFNDASPLTQYEPPRYIFCDEDLGRIAHIEVCRPSSSFGIDVFIQCHEILHL